jgi:hypothetical protein
MIETIDQDQGLRKEMIETIDQDQGLRKDLLVKKVFLKRIDLEISFHL